MKNKIFLILVLLVLPSVNALMGDELRMCYSADEVVANANTVSGHKNFTSVGAPGTRVGKVGGLAYDSPNDDNANYRKVLFPNEIPNASSNFTVSLWYTLDTTEAASNQFFVMWGKATNNNALGCYLGVSGGGSKNIWTPVSADYDTGVTNGISNWYHFAVTYNNNTGNVTVYRNGTQIDSRINALNIINQTFFIGQYIDAPSFGEFDGGIDEIMIFNRTLSRSEIQHLYNGSTGVSCAYVYDNRTEVNVQPNITSPLASPTSPCEDDNINWSVTFTDENEADLGNVTFIHYVNGTNVFNETVVNVLNGVVVSSLLGEGNFSSSSNISVNVSATDGLLTSDVKFGSVLTCDAESGFLNENDLFIWIAIILFVLSVSTNRAVLWGFSGVYTTVLGLVFTVDVSLSGGLVLVVLGLVESALIWQGK